MESKDIFKMVHKYHNKYAVVSFCGFFYKDEEGKLKVTDIDWLEPMFGYCDRPQMELDIKQHEDWDGFITYVGLGYYIGEAIFAVESDGDDFRDWTWYSLDYAEIKFAYTKDIYPDGEECWRWPLPGAHDKIPAQDHPGSFGFVRKHDVHCGIDLYCKPDQQVVAMESGRVVCIEIFTGPDATPPTPWWHETYAVYVEGVSGVIVYGEIKPSVQVFDVVKIGDTIGSVMTVLRNDKGLPMTMLHVELHKTDTRKTTSWELGKDRPETLLDPTEAMQRSNDSISDFFLW